MHELRPLEICVVFRIGRKQNYDQNYDGNGDGVDQRVTPAALMQPVCPEVSPQCRGQPEKRRGAKINPDARNGLRHYYFPLDAGAPVRRATATNTSTVTMRVSVVPTTRAARMGNHSALSLCMCSITPVPAGMNNKDRC